MTASRDGLLRPIDSMPDDQVDTLLADACRLSRAAQATPRRTWPPKFVGMIKDGPGVGSSPEYTDSVLSRGFGRER
ncbi:hypothetical protein BVU76_05705 [Mycolicibacterium porcinum]|nr:hypothetical protein BVU76_05705 [Mycolicibacterium porcinum]